jgi:hypothetical protein
MSKRGTALGGSVAKILKLSRTENIPNSYRVKRVKAARVFS